MHEWQDWEMLETLRIAELPRARWESEIRALTDEIRRRTDPDMDAGRVRAGVRAAYNVIQGRPDDYPRASQRLRTLYRIKGSGSARVTRPSATAPMVRRRQQPAVSTEERREWAPSEKDRARLLSFEGYGVDDPDIVFVGIEEYCDEDPSLQRANILQRCTARAYRGVRVDKDEALASLEGLVRTATVPVWEMMAKIMASLTGRPWRTELAALGSRPARHRPSTLLTELYPLPRPGTDLPWNGSYLADWFAAEFRSRSDYERKSKAISGKRLRRMLEQAPNPLIVFFYGVDVRRWAEEHLAPVLDGEFEGGRAAIARTKNGTVLVATGFYNGQHAATAFRERDIGPLARRIRAMVGDEIRALVAGECRQQDDEDDRPHSSSRDRDATSTLSGRKMLLTAEGSRWNGRTSMFCWRCGQERASLLGACPACGQASQRQRARWSSGGWQLEVAGERFADLNHRALAWYVTRAAVEHGLSPEAFRAHFRRHQARRFLSLSGRVSASEFRRRTRSKDGSVRYQCDEDEDLFYFEGDTWAVTDQLGPHTGEYVKSFGAAYPELSLRLWGSHPRTTRAR